jgi:hypothetical protein
MDIREEMKMEEIVKSENENYQISFRKWKDTPDDIFIEVKCVVDSSGTGIRVPKDRLKEVLEKL